MVEFACHFNTDRKKVIVQVNAFRRWWLTSMDGFIPFSSSLTFAFRIKLNLSCKWVGNLKVLELSTRAFETPCKIGKLTSISFTLLLKLCWHDNTYLDHYNFLETLWEMSWEKAWTSRKTIFSKFRLLGELGSPQWQ